MNQPYHNVNQGCTVEPRLSNLLFFVLIESFVLYTYIMDKSYSSTMFLLLLFLLYFIEARVLKTVGTNGSHM